MKWLIPVWFLLLFLSCRENESEKVFTVQGPKVVEAKGYVVPKDSMAEPKVVLVDESKLKKVPVGKPKVVPTNTNVHPAGKPKVVMVDVTKLRVITPGTDTFSLAKTVHAIDSPFIAKLPKSIPSLPFRMKDAATCNIQYLDVDQGMNSSYVMSVFEDKSGNIWFGTKGGGVSKYDGRSLTHFTKTEGLSNNIILSIIEDKSGNLWFGTNGGGVSKYDGKCFTHYTERQGLSKNIVMPILEDKSGNLWFGTNGGGVSKFDGKRFTHYTEKEGLGNNNIRSIIQDRRGNLWFGTYGGGVSRFDGRSFTNFTEKVGLSNNFVRSIIEDKDGNLWFGTYGGGVSKYDGRSFTHYTENEGLSNNYVFSMLEDRNGNIWFGTFGLGVSKFDGKCFTHYTEKEGLSNNSIWSIIQDKSGNLWFGTEGGGVSKYVENSFSHYTDKQGLGNSIVRSIFEDGSGNLWFGTESGGVSKYDGKNFINYTDNEGLSNNVVRSILEDKGGNLWFGTYNGGVCKFDGKSFTHYTEKEGLSHNVVWSILEDKFGNLWFGTYGGGVTKFDGKHFTIYSQKEGLSNNYVFSILEDRKGNLWFGTYGGGVSKYDGKQFTHYTEKDVLSNDIVFSILEDTIGNLWFGTYGGGVSKYDGKRFTHFTEKDGLSNNIVFSITEDKSRKNDYGIWLGTDKGLSYFNIKTNTFINFHKNDGLVAEDFFQKSVWLDSQNKIWWGSGKTLTFLDLNEFKFNQSKPEVRLDNIILMEKFIDYNNIDKDSSDFAKELKKLKFTDVEKFHNYPLNLELPYDINYLTFQFSAIDWPAPHQVKFQYKLDGLDRDWSSLAADNKADYRNLPFGNYTFRVRAIGSANKWSQIFSYSFTIHPPWWRTYWAYAIYFATLLSILIGSIKLREQTFVARQKELEFKVNEATIVIRNQKEEVEEKNREILDSINYAKRIQSAILPPPRVVKGFLKNSFILYLPKDIVAGDFYWMDGLDDTVYFAACDCTGHGVPGAMVSVVCNTALNRSLHEFELREPGKIFDKTRELVIENFARSDEDVKDGMDASLCCLQLSDRKLFWSGANNPLWIHRKGSHEIQEWKADKQPIGIGYANDPFSTHEIQLNEGDSIYIFTDGYADQFGGQKGKKLTKEKFRDFILSIVELDPEKQREQLLRFHDEWKGDNEQVDDICVIGVRV